MQKSTTQHNILGKQVRLLHGHRDLKQGRVWGRLHEPLPLYLDHLQTIISDLHGGEMVIWLDANAHSNLWHSKDEDQKGNAMKDFILQINLEILNRRYQPLS